MEVAYSKAPPFPPRPGTPCALHRREDREGSPEKTQERREVMARKKRKYVRQSTGPCRMECGRPGFGERHLCDPCRSSMCSISLNKDDFWMEARLKNLDLYKSRVVAVQGREVEFQHLKETASDKNKRRNQGHGGRGGCRGSSRSVQSQSCSSSGRRGSPEAGSGKTVHLAAIQ